VRLISAACGIGGAVTIAAACGTSAHTARQQGAPGVASLPATHVTRHSILIGRSTKGRPIRAYVIGDPHAARTMLIVGCIHGNEPAGIAIARRLVATTTPIPGLALWVVPVLNPDGVAAHTRQDGRGVDLNRNFPYRWVPLTGYEYSGPHALSEPESRAAVKLITRIRPQITIWYHQHATLIDLSGGNPDVERDYSSLVGLPAHELVRYPGSAPGWENATFSGTTAFVVELPTGSLSDGSIRRHVEAVLSAAREVARSGSGPRFGRDDAVGVECVDRADVLGEHPGQCGVGDRHVILLSGSRFPRRV
jgi:protein MpaA